jgi:hypothetical protein
VFKLPDTFPAQAIEITDFFKAVRTVGLETKAQPDDLGFTLRQMRQARLDALL